MKNNFLGIFQKSPKKSQTPIFFKEKLNLSRQKYQKAHLHDAINKYARLEKPPSKYLMRYGMHKIDIV